MQLKKNQTRHAGRHRIAAVRSTSHKYWSRLCGPAGTTSLAPRLVKFYSLLALTAGQPRSLVKLSWDAWSWHRAGWPSAGRRALPQNRVQRSPAQTRSAQVCYPSRVHEKYHEKTMARRLLVSRPVHRSLSAPPAPPSCRRPETSRGGICRNGNQRRQARRRRLPAGFSTLPANLAPDKRLVAE